MVGAYSSYSFHLRLQPDAGPFCSNAGFKLSLDLTNVSIPSLGFSASGFSANGFSASGTAQNPFDGDASPQHLSDSVFNETDVIPDAMVKEVRCNAIVGVAES